MQPKLTNAQKQAQLHQLQIGAFQAAQATSKQAGSTANGPGTPSLATSSGVIQTAGSNGSSQVQANASKLIAYGNTLQSTNPALSNLIIQLGQQGQVLGQSFASQNKTSIIGQWVTFTALWSQLYSSPDYKVLSASDQAYVLSLTKDSAQQTANYTQTGYTDMGGVGLPYVMASPTATPAAGVTPPSTPDATAKVTDNSNQTVVCGQNEACNK